MLRPPDMTVAISLTNIGMVAHSTLKLVQDVRLKPLWYRVLESKNAFQSTLGSKNDQKFDVRCVFVDVSLKSFPDFQ